MLGATRFGQPGRLNSINVVVVEAGANLDRQRNSDGLFDFLQDAFQSVVILQESRAAAMLHYLWRRTATVHIKDVGADFFSHLGGHAHALWLAPEDLHRERPLAVVEAHLAF